MRLASLFLAVMGTMGMYVPSALACQCMQPPPPKEAMERSDAVFSGRVAKVEVRDHDKVVTVEVTRRWKGREASQVEVRTGKGGGDCGYAFEEGERYLIYAHGSEDTHATSICTRTNTLELAEEDLKALGEGEAPTTQPAADVD